MDQGNTSGGLTFIGGLQLLLIGLKLTSTITWPWWQVLLPFFVDGVLAAFIFVTFAAWKSRR
jgi:hypothetical protein